MARKEEMASKKRKTPGSTAKEPKSAVKKAKTPGKKAESAKKVKKSVPKDPLQALLDTHSFLERVSTSYGDKIKCSITEHEMPPKAEVVEKHLGSKKLLQAREKWWSDDWAEKYEPEIVAHKHNDKKLYCTITEQSINKIPGEVEAHVNGKRFKNLKKSKDAKKAKQEALLEKRKARIAKRIAARKAAAAAKNGGKETTDDASAPEEEADVLDDLEDESSDEEDDELAELEDSNDDEDEEEEEEDEEEEEEEEEEESKPSSPPRRAAAVASRRRRGNK